MPDFVEPAHREQLRSWLDGHPSYRLASLEDCNCKDQVGSLRKGPGGVWKPQPFYEPYYATGDFIGDGGTGFAIVALPRHHKGKVLIVVFSGKPTINGTGPLVIARHEKSVAGLGLFARPPSAARPHNRWRLLFGAFESEAERVVIPRATHSN